MSERDRKYGRQHRNRRAEWARLVAAGGVSCSRCGLSIVPGQRWHLDHAEGGGYLGPSHARCNTSAGGVKGGAVRAAIAVGVGQARRPTPRPAAKKPVLVLWSRPWHGEDVLDERCPCDRCRAVFGAAD